jgi:chromosome segregation protein
MHVLPKIKSPKLKSKLFINTNTFMKKKKLKDILYMNTLKNQINTLNIKLEKKQEEILDYKTKCNDNNKDFNSLENDLLSDYDKLKELKYKNAKMCADLEDLTENYFLQRDENIKLKNRLKDFIELFNNYKENTEKNNICLEKKLKYFEEKNMECFIYHLNIGKNSSRFLEDNKSKLTEAGNLIEKINEEIVQINNDIKLKENDLKKYKNEIDILINKKNEINENKEKYEENIKNMNIKKEESDKKNKEKENINKNLKKELKEKKNKYKNIINKIKDINDIILQRDEEIIQLKEEIEKLKASKNVFYY